MTATTPTAWERHALVVIDDSAHDEINGTYECAKDGETPRSDEDPQAWFASHLAAEGAPDYVVAFERDWRELVTDENGNLDLDKIARELFDYRVVMDEASKVYDELSGGRLSKPNTAAHHVTDAADSRYAEIYAANLLDEIDDLDEPITREALVAIADGWSEGASEEHEQAKVRRAGASS